MFIINIEENNGGSLPRLDKKITDPQQRNRIVHQIIQKAPPQSLTPYYLQQMAKYLAISEKQKKQKTILTDNRMVTVNKRQTSFQGLTEKLQNGEDGIYNFMTGGDKNILFVPKIEITQDDINNIPGMKQLRQDIKLIQKKQKAATGKKRKMLLKQLIQMRQDQYILKAHYKPTITMTKLTKSANLIDLNENITINQFGQPESDGLVSFFNPQHVCAILCNYSKLKAQVWGRFQNDLYYLMKDFEDLVDRTLKQDYPILYDIMIYKIDGLSNKQIIKKIQLKYNKTYSVEYLSLLWRKKIPKIISQQAKKQYIIWYYTEKEKGKWKRCSRCHQIKLAHTYFFTKNKTSKDGFYSLCKQCRNKKKGESYGKYSR